MNTPVYYPPSFDSYEAYRVYINALVARKEAELIKSVR